MSQAMQNEINTLKQKSADHEQRIQKMMQSLEALNSKLKPAAVLNKSSRKVR